MSEIITMDFNADDASELITIVRTQKCKLNEEGFCKEYGVSINELRLAERGDGKSWIKILNKLHEAKVVQIQLRVEV
jgi:hypothetical protein